MASSVSGARPLADYARILLTGNAQKLREALDAPMLVWNAPAVREEQLLLSTRAGGAANRPAPGQPIAYEVKKGHNAQNVFAMGITVGRTENNDIVLDDNSVSRFHAFLQKDRKGDWKLVDAESLNGTWVGPVKLAPNKPQALKDAETLRFGDVQVQFFLPDSFVKHVQDVLKRG